MKYLVKYSPEMTIKSRPVRSRFAKQLKNNLVVLLGRISPEIEIIGRWDYIQINVPDSLQSELGHIEQILASTQGICFFEEVQHSKYEDLDDIFAKTLPIYRDKLDGKTFAVRCNRSGNQPFNSMDVEKFVGEA